MAFAAFARAVRAAKDFRAALDAVADDPATAMTALRRHYVDGALEAVEDVGFPLAFDLDRFVVVISAVFAFSHWVCSG
jgi:hypothetical protein